MFRVRNNQKEGGFDEKSRRAATSPEGRLNKPVIPIRPVGLRDVPLAELSSELLARIQEGSFSANEGTILLGCEIHKALEVVLDVHNNRLSRRRYRDLFGTFYEFVEPPRPTLKGATIVELGCGSINPYGLLFLFLMLGARRGLAIDLDEIQDVPRAARALADLAAMILIDPREVLGDYLITPEQVLKNIASFDLARLRAGDPLGLDPARLTYMRESVHGLSLAKGEADLVVSNAFFEHITLVDDAIAEVSRITRKGGIGVHTIDGSDHRRYDNPACHPLELLTEADNEPLVHGSNRIRPLEFASVFERHGFEVISCEPFESVEVTAELRSRLVEPFRSMTNEALTVAIAKFVVRRL
jgi:SAM-dependent methyltransferase